VNGDGKIEHVVVSSRKVELRRQHIWPRVPAVPWTPCQVSISSLEGNSTTIASTFACGASVDRDAEFPKFPSISARRRTYDTRACGKDGSDVEISAPLLIPVRCDNPLCPSNIVVHSSNGYVEAISASGERLWQSATELTWIAWPAVSSCVPCSLVTPIHSCVVQFAQKRVETLYLYCPHVGEGCTFQDGFVLAMGDERFSLLAARDGSVLDTQEYKGVSCESPLLQDANGNGVRDIVLRCQDLLSLCEACGCLHCFLRIIIACVFGLDAQVHCSNFANVLASVGDVLMFCDSDRHHDPTTRVQKMIGSTRLKAVRKVRNFPHKSLQTRA
jgi:hypothetical protein